MGHSVQWTSVYLIAAAGRGVVRGISGYKSRYARRGGGARARV